MARSSLSVSGEAANDTTLVYAYALADLPSLVRWLVVGEHLEHAESGERAALAKAEARSTPSTALDERLADAGTDVGNLSACIEWLKATTIIGGLNDPTLPGSAQPWLHLIERLLALDPALAALAAREWFRSLGDAAMSEAAEFVAVDGLDYTIAAYIAGVIDAVLGNDIRAETWLEIGEVEGEAGEDGVTSFLAACRLVRDVLRAGRGA